MNFCDICGSENICYMDETVQNTFTRGLRQKTIFIYNPKKILEHAVNESCEHFSEPLTNSRLILRNSTVLELERKTEISLSWKLLPKVVRII